jgi:DNA-directed RNA polymerase subunit RPC12/RpoP
LRCEEERGREAVHLRLRAAHSARAPECGTKLIERKGFFITKWNLTEDNRCPTCGAKISIKGSYRKRRWGFL